MIETCDLYPDVEMYKPMLVLKAPTNASELMSSKTYIAMPKKDGYWYSLIKTAGGDIYLFSRSKSKKTGFYSEKIDNVPHIKEWAQELPNDTILVGEIYYPGGTSKNVTSIMGCLAPKAIERQKGSYGKIHYWVHDILRYAGIDYVRDGIDFEHRYSALCENIDLKMPTIEEIEISPSKTGFDIEDCVCSWMEDGEEGAVLKLKSGLYLPGKRRKEMFKIKQDQGDMDFIITGFVKPEILYTGKEIKSWPYWMCDFPTEDAKKIRYLEVFNICRGYCPEGKDDTQWWAPVTKAYYNGWNMGITLGLYDGDKIINCGKCTSGFTDADRQDMAEHPEKYLNKCVTVGAMSVDKKEYSLRHPRFEKWHFEKPIEDCTVGSVFG